MTGRHDVLIVGGGLVGASLAIALDRSGLQVGLVETTPHGVMPPVFDQRNLSLASATVNALTALGVLAKLRAPTGPIRRIHVSRQGDFGSTVLVAEHYGRESFGQIVVARDFGEALEARLLELRGLTRYRPARFIGLGEVDSHGRDVRIADEQGERQVSARLLVAADGTRSSVRDSLGIATREHDYGQVAFVARVRGEKTPDGTAYERFGQAGPVVLLPRGDRHFGAIHCVAAEEADAVAAQDDRGWLANFQRAFGWREGRFLSCGERSQYPLVQVLSQQLISERVVVIGNAAQTLHPIGAQGFNLGLRDALTLDELVARADDPGASVLLDAYAARRREDRQRTVDFSDGLARITGNASPMMRPLRSLGLMAANQSSTLQSMLVGGAMGFRGDVPELCR